MDERKLAELFQSTVRDAPPASFDDTDVVLASKAITRRRRAMLAGGGSLAVVVLAVSLVLATGVFGHTLGGSSSSGAAMAPERQSNTNGTRLGEGPFSGNEGGPGSPRVATGFPTESPMQGGGTTGRVGPGADSTLQGCGPTDAELAFALAGELSSVGAPILAPAGVSCPPGTRVATYAVPKGSVTALLVPAGRTSQVTVRGLASSATPSASGTWTVFVVSQPSSSYATRLAAIEQAIATRF